MQIISEQWQLNLPKELCDKAGIKPGDSVDLLEHAGRITILKKQHGATDGLLQQLSCSDPSVSDEQSLLTTLDENNDTFDGSTE